MTDKELNKKMVGYLKDRREKWCDLHNKDVFNNYLKSHRKATQSIH